MLSLTNRHVFAHLIKKVELAMTQTMTKVITHDTVRANVHKSDTNETTDNGQWATVWFHHIVACCTKNDVCTSFLFGFVPSFTNEKLD